jgi:hypothetical protein
MIKKNLENQLNKKQKLENNKTNNYRCSSVEEKYNNPCFSKDLEKEYLDIKHLVKNSVERINVLFNNEEFKQKTSKKVFQNNINKININKFNFNNQDASFEFMRKEDEKINNVFQENNADKIKRNSFPINNNNFFEEAEEYKYNSNDLYEELKELGTNKIKINNKNDTKFFQQNQKNIIQTDNKALLNLESNKLYRNKDNNPKIKKINIANTMKTDKKQKNGYITNYLKTARHQDIIRNKEKKIEVTKFIQKNKVNNNDNKIKKNMRNSNYGLKHRNTNNSALLNEKNNETSIRGEKIIKAKYKNNSFKKDNSFYKKVNHNNSMDVDMDINLHLNNDNSCTNLNYNILNAEKNIKAGNKQIILSINKHLYKGEKRDIYLNKIFNEFKCQNNKDNNDEKKNKSKHNKLNTNLTLPSLHKESPSRFINNSISKKKFEKITTQNFLKMMSMLNQYLINNNLIEDYSIPDNKKILDEFSLFLNKNIKIMTINNKKDIGGENSNDGSKTDRVIKKDNNLTNNINEDLKNNQTNINKNKFQNKNRNLNEIFNNIINKYNIIVQNNNK